MEGWITLHRKFLKWEWFDIPEMVKLFIYLLLMAQHEERKYRGVVLKRGELITSVPTIMNDCKLTEQQTRTCIMRLKSTGEITCESTNRYTIITICNYDRYQGEKVEINGQNNGQPNAQATDKQRTSNGQTTDTNITTIKQLNNNNNNNISVCSNSAHTREEKERELIFQIFFLKNFINPDAEVERFYNNYEAQGWVRGNGQKIVDRIAVAKHWEQEEREKRRFPEPFVEAMREISEMPFYDPAIIRGIERIDCEATIVHLYCTYKAYEAIENSPARDIIKNKMQRQLNYRVKRTN